MLGFAVGARDRGIDAAVGANTLDQPGVPGSLPVGHLRHMARFSFAAFAVYAIPDVCRSLRSQVRGPAVWSSDVQEQFEGHSPNCPGWERL